MFLAHTHSKLRTSFGAYGKKKSRRRDFCIDIEYWDSYAAKWKPNAKLTICAKNKKLHFYLMTDMVGKTRSYFCYLRQSVAKTRKITFI